MPMETKAVATFTKAVNDRTVIGYVSVMGNIDDGMDRIWPGAFAKTLSERRTRIKYLWMHDAFQPPVAAIKDIKEVGRNDLPSEMLAYFPEAAGALEVEREYLDTARGNEVLAGVKAGAITESSIGYDPVKYDFESLEGGRQVRNLRELRLYDASDVAWGMNPATMNLKTLGEEMFFQRLDGMLHELKEGRVLSKQNMQRIKDALAMLQEILVAAEPSDEADSNAITTSKTLTESASRAIKQRIAIAERTMLTLIQ